MSINLKDYYSGQVSVLIWKIRSMYIYLRHPNIWGSNGDIVCPMNCLNCSKNLYSSEAEFKKEGPYPGMFNIYHCNDCLRIFRMNVSEIYKLSHYENFNAFDVSHIYDKDLDDYIEEILPTAERVKIKYWQIIQ
jgi:hypothetical protein